MRVILKLLECAKGLNLAVFQNADAVSKVQKVNGMRYKDPRLLLEHPLEDMLENLFAHIGIKGRDRVVHHDDISISINSPCQAHTRLLATRQVDAFLTNFCLVSSWQDIKITLQLARFNRLLVALSVIWVGKSDIVLDSLVLDPRSLLNVGDGATNLYRLVAYFEIRDEQALSKSIELFLRRFVLKTTELVDLALGDIYEVTYDRLQQA
mmetsp:Transcript_31387/g.38943  ORF Transcript_31387/g.38943 Transcript_31387/m.38943 type:complete len:209 (+) Transcript_31387:2443-3069(+)